MTTTTATDPPLTVADVATETGITYRQANYWCTRGYVHPIVCSRAGGRTAGRGTGFSHRLTYTEARVFRGMARLVRAGVDVQVAAHAARALVVERRAAVPIGDGVIVLATEVLR